MNLVLKFGYGDRLLKNQLAAQEFPYNENRLDKYQHILDAIHTLDRANMLKYVERERMLDKLQKRIIRHIEEQLSELCF